MRPTVAVTQLAVAPEPAHAYGFLAVTVQQSLAADGAIACFSSNLFLASLNADRAPQLKAVVRLLCLSVC